MKILKRSNHGYIQDPTKNFGFEVFDGCGDPNVVLIVAAFEELAGCWSQFNLDENQLKLIKAKRVVRLEFEEPNKFFRGENFDSYDYDFYKVFTLCPYTSSYLNARQNRNLREPIFFPFNSLHIPKNSQKKYDIIYTGHLISKPIFNDIRKISKFNYCLVSNSSSKYVTHNGVGYEQKIKLISESKITLVHNLLYPTFSHLRKVWLYEDWELNEAFKMLPNKKQFYHFFLNREQMLVPQLKSRAFEAAFSKSLILCKKDPFNIIENYFEAGKEFVYFEDGKLEETIENILSSYEDYAEIIDNAYRRAVKEYTTEAFFNKFLKEIK